MSESIPAFQNQRTGEVVKARPVLRVAPGGSRWLTSPGVSEGPGSENWTPGVIGPDGKFHPGDRSVSFVLKFPEETTAELDELIKEAGGDATELFKRAIALYKLARDAVHQGKAVGIASSPESLETQFVGL